MATKSIKLKCTASNINTFFEDTVLYKGRIKDDGSMQVRDKYGVWFDLPQNMILVGTIAPGSKEEREGTATFVELKTKTLKCMSLDHKNQVKKSFTVGKRYQVESGRALGGVAGYIFDNDGCRWTLFREEVGFSIADGTTFEAKYL